MKNLFIIILFISSFLQGCKNNKKASIPKHSDSNDKVAFEKPKKSFFSKDEISLPSKDSIYFAAKNEVIFFRPTEFDFGLRLENTQDQSLLNLDGNFEELTNEAKATFSGQKKVKISICEKPVVAIVNAGDTLYFNTSTDLYGVIFSKEGSLPELLSATEDHLIEKVKANYNLE